MATGREIVSFFDDDSETEEVSLKKNPISQFKTEKKVKSNPCELCDKYKNGGQLHPVNFKMFFYYIRLKKVFFFK